MTFVQFSRIVPTKVPPEWTTTKYDGYDIIRQNTTGVFGRMWSYLVVFGHMWSKDKKTKDKRRQKNVFLSQNIHTVAINKL